MDLAAQLGCPLVALCSKHSSATLLEHMARRKQIHFVAVDVAQLPDGIMPPSESAELLRGTLFERDADTSRKRNLGLLLAGLIGWESIVFLDDDISISNPQDLNDAAGLLGGYAAIGLAIGGFPDNSVVCHAYREVGGAQETFIGGGALIVGLTLMNSYFPDVYNEDWFFLLNDEGIYSTAVTGQAMQRPYDPYADKARARSEEFGDCLAEGVFALLDNGGRIEGADSEYWRKFLAARLRLIDEVIEGALAMDKELQERQRMVTALKAARDRCQRISPDFCVEYLEAWRKDRHRWRRHVETLHRRHLPVREWRERAIGSPGLGLEIALVRLGLVKCSRYVGPTEQV